MSADTGQKLMKDGLGRDAVRRLATALASVDSTFDAAAFQRRAIRGLGKLELKARVAHVVDALRVHLPPDFADARPIALAAGADFPAGDPDDPLRGFAAWPLIDWIAVHAGTEHARHFDDAVDALRSLTGLFTAEFAIRPFLLADTKRAMVHVTRWTRDPEDTVRRLASEGVRPRLPWAQRLPMFQQEPAPVLRILERLKDDPSESVRRSVANNLNDIAKDHPDRVVQVARKWSRGRRKERAWIIRHATRTLVKEGHPGALAVLGYTARPQVQVELALSPARMKLGSSLTLQLALHSRAHGDQRLVVDYAIHHRKANGTLAPKVFKLRNLDLAAGETLTIEKRHVIRAISTRRYYAGEHAVEILVNGKPQARSAFHLRM